MKHELATCSSVTSTLLLAVALLVVVVHCNFVVLYVHRTLLKTSLYIADVTFLSKEHF